MVIKLKIYSVNAMLSFPADCECLFDSSGQFQEDRLQINTKSCHVGNEKLERSDIYNIEISPKS